MSRILVVAFDPLDDVLNGPAIRALNLARVLAADHEVTLAGTAGVSRTEPDIAVRHLDGAALDAAAAAADAVVAPVSVARRHPGVVACGVPLAVDLSIPTHLENLAPAGRDADRHAADVDHQVGLLAEDVAAGDFFVCASARQRDFWLGALAAAGRVNPATAGPDPSLRSLIDVVPFGLPDEPPRADGHPLRARFGIGADEAVVVWGGGVYDWLDPVTAVRAVARLLPTRPDLHLVFLGVRNPNPGLPEPAALSSLRAAADELGLIGRHVHLNDGWVPYEERGAWLVDADAAISTHGDHLETRFSFRTRVLDYLWAGRPMILTGGDELSEQVAAAGLGAAAPAGDVEAAADGIDRMLRHPPNPEAFAAVAAQYRWRVVAEPLRQWCRSPRPAADRPGPATGPGRPATVASMSTSVTPSDPRPGADAEARAERAAPGYLGRVRTAAARLAVGPDRRGDLRASLAALADTATVDVDVPTLSRRPPVRYLKVGVRSLTRWYVRYVGQQVTAFATATVGFGEEVAERTDELAASGAAAAARLAELEARVAALEGGGSGLESRPGA